MNRGQIQGCQRERHDNELLALDAALARPANRIRQSGEFVVIAMFVTVVSDISRVTAGTIAMIGVLTEFRSFAGR